MLIIPSAVFRKRILETFEGAKVPEMCRAKKVMIVHADFFRKEWKRFWDQYRTVRKLTYFNTGICDLMAQTAANEFNWMANKEAAKKGFGDIAGGMCEARIQIAAGFELHGVGGEEHPSHSTDIVGITEDNKNWGFCYWEPQERINAACELTAVSRVDGVYPVDILD